MAQNTDIADIQVGGPQAVGSIFSKVDFEVDFGVDGTLASGDYVTLYEPGAGYRVIGATIEVVTPGTATSTITVADQAGTAYGVVDLDGEVGTTSGSAGAAGSGLRIVAGVADADEGVVKVTALVVDVS